MTGRQAAQRSRERESDRSQQKALTGVRAFQLEASSGIEPL